MNNKPRTGVVIGEKLAGQQKFLTPLLEKACEFLECKRHEGAWGLFRGNPTELYYAQLALSALRAMYPEASHSSKTLQTQIAAIELAAKSAFAEKTETLDMKALTDFIGILRAQGEQDQDLIEALAEQLGRLVKLHLKRPQTLRVRDFARALVALFDTKIAKPDLLERCAQSLKELEKTGEGGWPGGTEGDASVIATACVVEALRTIDPNGSADAISRGERYLEAAVSDGGWQRIGTGDDVFAQAIVLRVLAGTGHSEAIEAGAIALKASANDDGWGLAPQHASTVEATATAILALAACGENQFVPYRVAAAQLSNAINKTEASESELAKLRQNLRHQVAQESGAILKDRDKLRREAKEQSVKIVELEAALRNAERAAVMQFRRSQELYEDISLSQYKSRPIFSLALSKFSLLEIPFALFAFIVGVGLYLSEASRVVLLGVETSTHFVGLIICVASIALMSLYVGIRHHPLRYVPALVLAMVGLALIFADAPSLTIFGFVVPLMLAAALVLYAAIVPAATLVADLLRWQFRLRRQIEIVPSKGPVTSAVREYADLASQLPPPVREEFNFLLYSRLVDMPKDVGLQYVSEALDRLKVPRSFKARFLSWIVDFLDLDSFSRRAVVEQVRRHSQP